MDFLQNIPGTKNYSLAHTEDFKGRNIKANLSWSRTQVKFFHLIASLSVILRQLKLTKLKLEVLKSDFPTQVCFYNTALKTIEPHVALIRFWLSRFCSGKCGPGLQILLRVNWNRVAKGRHLCH